MPNGFYGSKEEWERLVAPLRQFDAALDEFAAQHGIAVERNYHNMPNRVLTWKRGGIIRQIEIDLYGQEPQIQFSWQAYRDAGRERRGKRGPVITGISLPRFHAELTQLLENARANLEAIAADDLEHWIALDIDLDAINYLREEFHGPGEAMQAPLVVFLMDVPYLLVRGVLPPLHILNEILELGHLGGGMSPGARWTPFSLTEAEYETLVAQLPKIWKSARKRGKPRFPPQQIRIDPGFASAKTFEEWVAAVSAKYPRD